MVSSDLDDILDALPAQDKHEMSRKSLRKSAATMGRIKKNCSEHHSGNWVIYFWAFFANIFLWIWLLVRCRKVKRRRTKKGSRLNFGSSQTTFLCFSWSKNLQLLHNFVFTKMKQQNHQENKKNQTWFSLEKKEQFKVNLASRFTFLLLSFGYNNEVKPTMTPSNLKVRTLAIKVIDLFNFIIINLYINKLLCQFNSLV